MREKIEAAAPEEIKQHIQEKQEQFMKDAIRLFSLERKSQQNEEEDSRVVIQEFMKTMDILEPTLKESTTSSSVLESRTSTEPGEMSTIEPTTTTSAGRRISLFSHEKNEVQTTPSVTTNIKLQPVVPLTTTTTTNRPEVSTTYKPTSTSSQPDTRTDSSEPDSSLLSNQGTGENINISPGFLFARPSLVQTIKLEPELKEMAKNIIPDKLGKILFSSENETYVLHIVDPFRIHFVVSRINLFFKLNILSLYLLSVDH